MEQNLQTAIAIHQVITNEAGDEPIDYFYVDVNPAYAQVSGLTKIRHEEETPTSPNDPTTTTTTSSSSSIIGKRVTEVFPGIETDAAHWIQLFGTIGLKGGCHKFTQYSDTLQQWYSGVVYQTDATLHQFAVSFMEITDHFQIQHQQLLDSEERHRNLFESMMQGVVYQEASGTIIAANPAAESILGLTVDQMMGRTSVDPRWRSVQDDGTDFPGNDHPSMKALQTGTAVTNVTMGVYHPGRSNNCNTNSNSNSAMMRDTNTTNDDATSGDDPDINTWIKIDAIPRFRNGDETTPPYQVYTTFTDITETKRFERNLLRAIEKAEEADKLKSAFLANMSHEIRTPLNGIIGHIDLALSNNLSEEWRNENVEGLLISKTSGNLLLSIIQDILDLSKIEAGQMVVNDDESFSLQAIMTQTIGLSNTLIKSKNKTISFVGIIEQDNPNMKDFVLGDPFRLQQVINNIASNAIKFTSVGKVELRVRMLDDNETLEFALLDTGKGIPASHIESIFEPFRQVEIGDTRVFGGTGLGLTISRKLVQMMGGTLRLESSVLGPIRGSMFAFTIPYRQCPSNLQPQPDVLPPLPSPVGATTPATNKSEVSNGTTTTANATQTNNGHDRKSTGKILVAEDDPVSRKLVNRMLQRTGYEAILACDGREAVTLYEDHKDEILLVLMDVQMPRLSGHEATQEIRNREKAAGEESPIPIIGLSAGAMKGDLEKGLSFGMTDYLTKPVDFQGLRKTLNKFLGSND